MFHNKAITWAQMKARLTAELAILFRGCATCWSPRPQPRVTSCMQCRGEHFPRLNTDVSCTLYLCGFRKFEHTSKRCFHAKGISFFVALLCISPLRNTTKHNTTVFVSEQRRSDTEEIKTVTFRMETLPSYFASEVVSYQRHNPTTTHKAVLVYEQRRSDVERATNKLLPSVWKLLYF